MVKVDEFVISQLKDDNSVENVNATETISGKI